MKCVKKPILLKAKIYKRMELLTIAITSVFAASYITGWDVAILFMVTWSLGFFVGSFKAERKIVNYIGYGTWQLFPNQWPLEPKYSDKERD